MATVRSLAFLLGFVALGGCTVGGNGKLAKGTFGNDLAFIRKYMNEVVLSDTTGKAQVVVLPKLQGRVMTSTADGMSGLSFGWINRELFASGEILEHINVYGGEDRFWLGPEGGQFSIFFKKGVPFDLEHWFTPAEIDTEPFELVSKSRDRAILKKHMRLENYSGTVLSLRADREVRVLEKSEAQSLLGVSPGDEVKLVAYESINKVTNTGALAWKKETGLLSIWILGMYNPSPATTVVVPFNAGPEAELGPVVNDAYFGKVPSDRLVVAEGVLYFSGDGRYRSKIGLSPQRSKSALGSYDAVNKVLTIVQYNKPGPEVVDYVNSMWELQDEPYKGDVVNSYNDGPAEPGAEPLGPFYELETSSPAAALKPGRTISHTHRTFHLQGPEPDLDVVAKAILGVTTGQIESALSK
jgi:hypothetical protein